MSVLRRWSESESDDAEHVPPRYDADAEDALPRYDASSSASKHLSSNLVSLDMLLFVNLQL